MSENTTPQVTPADILPKSKKGDKSPLEIIKDAKAIIEAQTNSVKAEFQRRLQTLASDRLTLESMGVVIDWSSPEFGQALNELKLQGIPTDEPKQRKRMSPANSKSDWGSMRVGKLVLEKFSKSDEITADIIMKKFDLSKNTATQYLSKGSSDGYLESLGGGRYKRLK